MNANLAKNAIIAGLAARNVTVVDDVVLIANGERNVFTRYNSIVEKDAIDAVVNSVDEQCGMLRIVAGLSVEIIDVNGENKYHVTVFF
jgi:hypothetical protein